MEGLGGGTRGCLPACEGLGGGFRSLGSGRWPSGFGHRRHRRQRSVSPGQEGRRGCAASAEAGPFDRVPGAEQAVGGGLPADDPQRGSARPADDLAGQAPRTASWSRAACSRAVIVPPRRFLSCSPGWVQGLDLALLVEGEDDHPLRRRNVQVRRRCGVRASEWTRRGPSCKPGLVWALVSVVGSSRPTWLGDYTPTPPPSRHPPTR